MKRKLLCTLLCIVLFCKLCVGQGFIRCYVCTTQSGRFSDRCGDEFRLTSVDASACQGTCLKTRGHRSEGSRSVAEVTRGCVAFQDRDECTEGSHTGISADICYCNTDLCNSAQNVKTSTWVLVTSVILSLGQIWKYRLQ